MKRNILLTAALATTAALTVATPAAASDGACHATGAGLTANYVNEVPAEAFEVTCDIGVYFDTDATLDGVEVTATADNARAVQHGVYVDGAAVDLRRSTISTSDDYPNQFLGVAYYGGATGNLDGNTISGAHRVGVLLRGAGTDVVVEKNTIEGSGPKSEGWGENGIQVDSGATAVIGKNTVADHWWNRDDFNSAGIAVYGGGVTVEGNTVRNNDLGVALLGSDNSLGQNLVDITHTEADVEGVYGVYSLGDNTIVRNRILSNLRPAQGIGLIGSGTRNVVRGWDTNLAGADEDDNTVPGPRSN